MNTIRSTWVGWGTLCVAGGGAYWFAKKQINADRQSRLEEEIRRKDIQRRMEAMEADSRNSIAKKPKKKKTISNGDFSDTGATSSKSEDHAGSPSAEISQDAAPVGHAPGSERDGIVERSKYEAAEPFKSRKGDRFS